MNKRNGFTLIELMIVLAIVSILSMVAVPSFSGMIQQMSATAQAEEIYSGFRQARAEALKRNESVVFEMANDGWRVCPKKEVDAGNACSSASDEEEGVVLKKGLRGNVSLSMETTDGADATTAVFNSRGVLSVPGDGVGLRVKVNAENKKEGAEELGVILFSSGIPIICSADSTQEKRKCPT